MTTEDPRYGAPTGAPAYGQGQPPRPEPSWGPGSAAGYDPAGYGQQQPVQRRNGLGIAALVLGLLAVLSAITVVGGVVLGVAAFVLGALGRGRARRGEASNGGVALAGLVLGLVGVLLAGALVAVGVSVLNSDSGQKYRDCLSGAGDDRAAAQACADQFGKDLTD